MIVITGAAGFIGSNVVASLNALGRTDIAVCDRLGHDNKWQNLRKRSFQEWVFPSELMDFLAHNNDVSAIIHLGANSSTTSTDADDMIRTNFQFSVKLLDWCTVRGVPLVYASSAATYGDATDGFIDGLSLSSLRRLRPLNVYGWSKNLFDQVVAERTERRLAMPPKCIGLKFFNVYGPNEYHKGAMQSVIAKNYAVAAGGGEVQLYKSYHPEYPDGGQKRDFIYVEDAVDVVLWALDRGPVSALLNVGTGQATTFRELVEAMFAAADRSPRLTYVEMPEHLKLRYQYFTQASLSSLRAAGYDRPFLPVDVAVSRYVRHLSQADCYR